MKRIAFSTAVAIGVAWAGAAQASCLPSTPEQQRQRADVIFLGAAIEGPMPTGVQRFRVARYEKGSGPREVSVATGVIRRADGSGSTTSVSIEAVPGQTWRVFARRAAKGVLETNQCDGTAIASSVEPPAPPNEGDADRNALIVGASVGGLALVGMALGLRRRRYRA